MSLPNDQYANFPLKNDLGVNIFNDKIFREPSIWDLIKELIRPPVRTLDCMQVEVTSLCFASCSYCPQTIHAATWKGEHMLPLTFANLWPLFKRCTRVHLQGWGEPFLHPNFFEMLAFARKAGCLTSSTSCGLHLTEKIALQIINSGMDILAFSLAGTDAESNSSRHGVPFEKVCEKIHFLQKIRKKHYAVHLELHLAYIMLADRMPSVLKLPELMHKLGVSTAIISTMDYIPSPKLAHLGLTPADTEKLAIAKELLEEASHKAEDYGVQLHYTLPTAISGGVCRENIQKCLYVDTQGTISPCVYLNVPSLQAQCREVFGNVNEENSADIWCKDDFVLFRQNHADGHPTSPLCISCVKRH